ncbi:MAG: MFS transporter [Planctomycetaceae bacterium]|nr:MFS transporter [Planctomycetaceae bacterium]
MRQDRALLRLVLLVSCAHAMVHLLEQSFASVELTVSAELGLSKAQSGRLGTALRFPYGFGALLAGIISDRLGSRRILLVYLAGGALVCGSMVLNNGHALLYVQLFLLGSFASMYHPAGLALLTTSAPASLRGRALGIHGVFGSAGIALAPFIAGVTLMAQPNGWRWYYLVLGGLGMLLASQFRRDFDTTESQRANQALSTSGARNAEQRLKIAPFAVLTMATAIAGIVYAGFLHFLKRYLSERFLDEADIVAGAVTDRADLVIAATQQVVATSNEVVSASVTATGTDASSSMYTAITLACGALGQWIAGQIARPGRLPLQLSLIFASNAPLLLWMTVAHGNARVIAAGLFAFVHFMNQPVYNSLLPEFIPAHRRSTWFGFSNMMGFGIGSFGPAIVGELGDFRQAYFVLAILALVAAALPLTLYLFVRHEDSTPDSSAASR